MKAIGWIVLGLVVVLAATLLVSLALSALGIAYWFVHFIVGLLIGGFGILPFTFKALDTLDY